MLFHDISEVWTDDIPSPVKDKVKIYTDPPEFEDVFGGRNVTLRKVAEFLELQALEEHFYIHLPKKIEEFFRDGVMMEDCDDPELMRFYKAADYFAADLEVWWNIKGGSREYRFKELLSESLARANRTENQKALLKSFLAQCEGIPFIN